MAEDVYISGEMFWKRFDIILKEKKLSQNSIAKKAGISSQSISVARKNGSMPTFDRGMRIAEALGVSPQYMFSGKHLYETKELDDAIAEIVKNDLASHIAIDIASFNYKEKRMIASLAMEIRISKGERNILPYEKFPEST